MLECGEGCEDEVKCCLKVKPIDYTAESTRKRPHILFLLSKIRVISIGAMMVILSSCSGTKVPLESSLFIPNATENLFCHTVASSVVQTEGS